MMPRKVRHHRSLIAPLAENFYRRVSQTDVRIRRKIYYCAAAGLFALFGWAMLTGEYGIPRILELKKQKSALERRNAELRVELVDLDRKRLLLQTDRAYLERIARTKYHMVYPNETLFRFEQ